MTSVLFVCMGNICRSPTAEGVFRELHRRQAPELKLQIDSAGTHAYHVGEPPDTRAQAAALRRGVDISRHRGRQLSAEDFLRFDYVLAMDKDNLRRMQALRPAQAKAVVRLFLEYGQDLPYSEVPDPYYGGMQGFETVLDLVATASLGLLEDVRQRIVRGG